MSAEILRRAASLMRERAETASGPEWGVWHMLDDGRAEIFVPTGSMDAPTVLEFKDHMDCEECVRPSEADAEHIASWHPAVALAVADWLEVESGKWDAEVERYPAFAASNHAAALAVARAYLREAS